MHIHYKNAHGITIFTFQGQEKHIKMRLGVTVLQNQKIKIIIQIRNIFIISVVVLSDYDPHNAFKNCTILHSGSVWI